MGTASPVYYCGKPHYLSIRFGGWIYYSEVFFISKDHAQINSAIRDKEVRLIDVDGTMIGVVSARDAAKSKRKGWIW